MNIASFVYVCNGTYSFAFRASNEKHEAILVYHSGRKPNKFISWKHCAEMTSETPGLFLPPLHSSIELSREMDLLRFLSAPSSLRGVSLSSSLYAVVESLVHTFKYGRRAYF